MSGEWKGCKWCAVLNFPYPTPHFRLQFDQSTLELSVISFFVLELVGSLIESFRFEDENVYKYKI